jgi:hypothetical protein
LIKKQEIFPSHIAMENPKRIPRIIGILIRLTIYIKDLTMALHTFIKKIDIKNSRIDHMGLNIAN